MRFLPLAGRVVLAGSMLVIGLGRLGLYVFQSPTFGPNWLYGMALLLGAVGLLVTAGCKSHGLRGRLVAVFCMATLIGFAVDVSLAAGTCFNTSALSLFFFAFIALTEVVARHDCTQH